jgi:hypothetical protein
MDVHGGSAWKSLASGEGSSGNVRCVERKFFRRWLRWHLVIDIFLGR